MHRQTLVPGALEALGRIGEVADIVILTNLGDEAHPWRVAQLATHGIAHEVVCNQGGKGVPARAIIERLGAGTTVFVDDLPVHHASVAKHAPEVWRLHMVAEPRLAPAVPPASTPMRGSTIGRPRRLDHRPADRESLIRRAANAWGSGMTIDQRLAELGITLPTPAAPVASYVPAVEANGLLHISGQISFAEDGSLIKGRLGEDVDLDAGIAAARRCGIMLLAQMKAALGSLDRVGRVVKLGVFVNSAGDFTDQPKVANGASELMQDVFGEAGRHARSAVGVPVLPLGVAVEVDAIVQIRGLTRSIPAQPASRIAGLHSGSAFPENSLIAFAAALELGAGIECDLRLTADNRDRRLP